MSDAAVRLCSEALRLIGANPIAAFDDGSAEAEMVAALWPGLRDALLSAHPWNFAQAVSPLARLAQPPHGWRSAFQPPPDLIELIALFPSPDVQGTPVRRFDWQDQRIVADLDEAWALHRRRVPEALFPAPFALLCRYALAAELAMPLTERPSVAEYWTVRAYGQPSEGGRGGQFRLAARADAQAAPPVVLPPAPLALARHRG